MSKMTSGRSLGAKRFGDIRDETPSTRESFAHLSLRDGRYGLDAGMWATSRYFDRRRAEAGGTGLFTIELEADISISFATRFHEKHFDSVDTPPQHAAISREEHCRRAPLLTISDDGHCLEPLRRTCRSDDGPKRPIFETGRIATCQTHLRTLSCRDWPRFLSYLSFDSHFIIYRGFHDEAAA